MLLPCRSLDQILRPVHHLDAVPAVSPRHFAQPRLFPQLEQVTQILKNLGCQRQLMSRRHNLDGSPPNPWQLKKTEPHHRRKHKSLALLASTKRHSTRMCKRPVIIMLESTGQHVYLPRKQMTVEVSSCELCNERPITLVPIYGRFQPWLIRTNANR